MSKYNFKISFKDKDSFKSFISKLAKILEEEDKDMYLCECGKMIEKKKKYYHNKTLYHKNNCKKVIIKDKKDNKKKKKKKKIEIEEN